MLPWGAACDQDYFMTPKELDDLHRTAALIAFFSTSIRLNRVMNSIAA
jgi:hypothetical protein